jgi:hypothetical protein
VDDTELRETFFRYASQRKRRLYQCACCRLVWGELKDDRSRAAVVAAELYADGRITRMQLAAAEQQAWHVWNDSIGGTLGNGTWNQRSFPYAAAAYNVASEEMSDWGAVPIARSPSEIVYDLAPDQATLAADQRARMRDLLGEPSTLADPSWLTSTVVALARQMYEAREFSAMPILADALQDAGCDHADILDHCRSPQAHVRGCWVVDLLLGTEERPAHEHPVFGQLKWDGRENAWLGEVELRPGARIGIVVLGADENRDAGFPAARDSLAWLRTHEATARQQTATDKVWLHNDRRPVGSVALTAAEFAVQLEPLRAELAESGDVRLTYRDVSGGLADLQLVAHFGPDREYWNTCVRQA